MALWVLFNSSLVLDLLDCGYRNSSDRMVIVRCCGPSEFYLERVVFPFELLSFHSPPGSEVEIWTHGLGGPELLETFRASELCLESSTPPLAELALEGLHRQENPWLEAS
jgi:hypothetical protein